MLILGAIGVVTEQPQGRPGRNYKGHDEGEHHGRRSAHRNGAHVRSHQAAHKGHRKDSRDHCKGCEDGWIPHFVDGFDGDIGQRAAAVFSQSEMADDVLDDNDGIVYEDTDGEDQREKGDSVERVAVEIEDGQCEGQGHRDS